MGEEAFFGELFIGELFVGVETAELFFLGEHFSGVLFFMGEHFIGVLQTFSFFIGPKARAQSTFLSAKISQQDTHGFLRSCLIRRIRSA